MSKTCLNPNCPTHEFEPSRPDQKYCSDSCRAADFRRRRKLEGLAGPPSPSVPAKPSMPVFKPVDIPMDLPAHARWIIDQQDKQIHRLEAEVQKLDQRNESLLTERDQARTDLATFKTETQIKDIQNAKPAGLSGLLPGGIEGLLNNPHVGPVLGALLGKIAGVGTHSLSSGAIEGEAVANLVSWISSQPEEVQQSFGELIAGLIDTEPEKTGETIKRLVQLLKSGTTIQTPTPNVSGTYGYD